MKQNIAMEEEPLEAKAQDSAGRFHWIRNREYF